MVLVVLRRGAVRLALVGSTSPGVNASPPPISVPQGVDDWAETLEQRLGRADLLRRHGVPWTASASAVLLLTPSLV